MDPEILSSLGKSVLYVWWFSGKVGDIQKEDIKKFKEATKEEEIPEENIVNIINIGNVTIFLSWIYH